MKNLSTLMVSLMCVSFIYAQVETVRPEASATTETTGSSIGLDAPFSYKMLESNQDLRKISILIDERKNGMLDNGEIIIGTQLIAIADYQKSNTDSKFAYLMRHPTANNQIGKEVSEAVVHSFQLSFTGAVNSWLAAHAEMLYDPEQSFGAGTITALGRNQIQLRKAYILLGDLNKFPFYGALGKMDAPFGQTGSVNPFTNSTVWHAFGGLGYGAQLGFKKWNFHGTLMGVQGGAQFRAMNTMVGDSTNIPSKINNLVADLNYTLASEGLFSLTVGGSYLHGTAYNHGFPVIHFEPGVIDNPATTAYAKLKIKERLVLMGGFTSTFENWPGTHNQEAPLDVFKATEVTSMQAGGKYLLNPNGKTEYTISGEFSNFVAGPDGAPWERQNQFVLGLAGMINHSSKLFLEIFRTEGYVPLNFISGSDPFAPFPPGETHSVNVDDAESLGIVIGGQIVF